jgi:hypothetical protein
VLLCLFCSVSETSFNAVLLFRSFGAVLRGLLAVQISPAFLRRSFRGQPHLVFWFCFRCLALVGRGFGLRVVVLVLPSFCFLEVRPAVVVFSGAIFGCLRVIVLVVVVVAVGLVVVLLLLL